MSLSIQLPVARLVGFILLTVVLVSTTKDVIKRGLSQNDNSENRREFLER